MKKFLLLFCMLIAMATFAQHTEKAPVLIFAQGTSIKASLDGNNDTVSITLLSKKKDGKFSIVNANAKNETDWVRKYMLMTDADEDLKISFTGRIAGSVGAELKEIFSKTKKGSSYKLYTIATPADPNQAATVRVRRIFLCKVVIK